MTSEWLTTRKLPKKGQERGRALMELNARAYLGAANAGVGHDATRRYLGALDLHVPSKSCWYRIGRNVKDAMIEVGNASERKALLLERRLAYRASGGELDDLGRIGIPISFDGAWPRRTQAKNSQEGFGTAIGGRSGKVVASVSRQRFERRICRARH